MALKFSLPIGRGALYFLVFCFLGRTGFSQEQRSPTPYELHLKTDLPVFGVAGAASVLSLFDHPKRSCPCSPSNVNGFDRSTTDRRSDSLERVSYVAAIVAVAWPTAATLLDARTSNDRFVDAMVTGEAVLVNVALNQMIKIGVHRPRPFIYKLEETDDLLKVNDNYFSFYSQHTSLVFAAGMTYARTFALRHPRSKYRWLAYTAVAGGGVTVASLRVLSGRHFPTDVIMGAAAGTSIGLLIPQIHLKSPTTGLIVVPTLRGATFSVRVPFG